jgi:hypothetical protein
MTIEFRLISYKCWTIGLHKFLSKTELLCDFVEEKNNGDIKLFFSGLEENKNPSLFMINILHKRTCLTLLGSMRTRFSCRLLWLVRFYFGDELL